MKDAVEQIKKVIQNNVTEMNHFMNTFISKYDPELLVVSKGSETKQAKGIIIEKPVVEGIGEVPVKDECPDEFSLQFTYSFNYIRYFVDPERGEIDEIQLYGAPDKELEYQVKLVVVCTKSEIAVTMVQMGICHMIEQRHSLWKSLGNNFIGRRVMGQNAADKHIDEVLKKMQHLRLESRHKDVVKAFLTYYLQTGESDKRDVQNTYFNLLVRANDTDRALDFVEILANGMMPKPMRVSAIKEAELMRKMDRGENIANFFRDSDVINVIYACGDAPARDTDLPSSDSRAENEKQIRLYYTLWDYIASLAKLKMTKKNPLVVIVSEDVCKSSFKTNTEIYYRICGHHVSIPEMTEAQTYDELLNAIGRSSLRMAEGFEPALKKYFDIVYPKAELRKKAFVDDLMARLLANYFSVTRVRNEFTEDCIPKYNAKIQTAGEILGELDQMTGLKAVKEEMHAIYKNKIAGFSSDVQNPFHMFFVGNPGTGKTTVARLTANLLYTMGVVKSGKFVETKPSDFISVWRGGTGQKALAKIAEAYDGVLFIDEAYGLAADDDNARQVLNILIQQMENNSDRLTVIFAGYEEDMHELMKANPGIESRVKKVIKFEDYSEEELMQILMEMLQRNGFVVEEEAKKALEGVITGRMAKEFFGNAREMRTLFNEIKEVLADDYYELVRQTGSTEGLEFTKVVTPAHVEKLMPPKAEVRINDLIGLKELKEQLQEFKDSVAYQVCLRDNGMTKVPAANFHMIFEGNPGTGKTTVAKLLADDLYSIGLLKTNKCVIVERKDLVSYSKGKTPAQNTADIIKTAVGGILFVDEAYALADGNGKEVVEVLLTAMENHKENTIFIFAGYSEEMQYFLNMNSGIKSRIGYTFHFEDYTPQELLEIFTTKMGNAGFVVSDDALRNVENIMEYFSDMRNFGNGRFVDHIIQETLQKRAKRKYDSFNFRNINAEDIPEIKEVIETSPDRMMLYDPQKITEEERRKTAVHELGHAMAILVTGTGEVPESISIRNRSASLGRVTLKPRTGGNMTEEDCKNHLITLLSGRNAERLFYNTNSSGCRSDYKRAKNMAKIMVKDYAMGDIGVTKPVDFLKEADQRATEILAANKDFIDKMADVLLSGKVLTGEELEAAYKEYIACNQ